MMCSGGSDGKLALDNRPDEEQFKSLHENHINEASNIGIGTAEAGPHPISRPGFWVCW